jgi:hypothetical protein
MMVKGERLPNLFLSAQKIILNRMKKLLLFFSLVLVNSALMAQTQPGAEKPYDKVIIYTGRPANIINIDIKNTKEKIVFRMYNETGKDVTNKVTFVTDRADKKEMDITNLQPGTYFIWYHADDAYRVSKLVKG